MKILFLTPYPFGEAPSQRFRFEQYYPLLQQKGIHFRVQPFLNEATWKILYKRGYLSKKIGGIILGFIRRCGILFTLRQYDFIFVHREASPIGPPLFEWLVASVFNKKLIYDFDDAIWLPNTSAPNKIASSVKWHGKVANICRWAYKISCGNEYLCEYARHFNSNTVLNPTTIDTERLHTKSSSVVRNNTAYPIHIKDGNHQTKQTASSKIVLGWTGTHSTMGYFHSLLPIIARLASRYHLKLIIISNQPPGFSFPFLTYIPWNKDSEIDDLRKLDIGLMPLTHDKWAMGKCGFKALQYMALGIPAVVSPVGVNTQIVQHGLSGFLCDTPDEWEAALETLIKDKELRMKMGEQGRLQVEKHYSVHANTENFLGLFRH
jgi:glycosyltransferase involved in cell wall biosynthesis